MGSPRIVSHKNELLLVFTHHEYDQKTRNRRSFLNTWKYAEK
jgi:hypothetical protein